MSRSGIRYESVRRRGHENRACFLPAAVADVVRADRFEIDVPPTGKVVLRRLARGDQRAVAM